MTINAVIFDLDGVLIDSLPAHYKSYVQLYAQFGIKYPFSEFVSKDITAGAVNSIPRVLKEHGKNNKQIAAIIKNRKLDFRRMLKEKNTTAAGIQIKLHKGVLPLLKQLKKSNYKMAVASGGTHFFVHHILRKNHISKYFSVVVTGSDRVKKKPHPDIFLKAAKKLHVMPKDCLVIEDAKDGVTAARRAGMKVIGHYVPKYKQDLSRSDRVVRSMGKINVRVIEKL